MLGCLRKSHLTSNWQIYTLNWEFFMKTNKDVRATLCLGIYTTWRNKTYIVRGIAKKFSLRPVEAKSLLDCGIISFETDIRGS